MILISLIILIIDPLSSVFEILSASLSLLTFGGDVLPCLFYISYISMLGYMQLMHISWLELLITYSLSVEIVLMFRQDSVVTRLRCNLSLLV
jgi:hypothetical protein